MSIKEQYNVSHVRSRKTNIKLSVANFRVRNTPFPTLVVHTQVALPLQHRH